MVRDDLNKDHAYSVAANHDEEHGKAIRKTVMFVTVLLTAITIFEVVMGASIKQFYDFEPNPYWWMVKWLFIGLTIFKAGYIVMKFMHLGDEARSFKYMLLTPYFIFIAYLIFILLTESSYWNTILFP